MTLTADSRERDDDVGSTVIGPDFSSLLPPGSIVANTVDPEEAEAHTIIVSRADLCHLEQASARAVVPAVVPTAVPAAAPVPVPGPEPGQRIFAIRIGAHPPISLEATAYIGRRPSAPRIVGSRMPRLVMVPSPSKEVSSTHVEILQEADTVVVTDLGSTNGTTVVTDGFPSRTLRQGESLVVGAEAVVDIGDGIRIVIVTLPEVATTEGTP